MKRNLLRVVLPTLTTEELVKVITDVDDPFEQSLPSIMENTRENLHEIAEEHDTEWVIDAIKNGRWNKQDKYIEYTWNGQEIYSFNTADELIKHHGLDCLLDTLSDNDPSWEIEQVIFPNAVRRLIDELKEYLDE